VPERFLMVGNSLKSDIWPVLELGGSAAYVPYRITWAVEQAQMPPPSARFHPLSRIGDLPRVVASLDAESSSSL
jgi:putative hydrolase of the HAD superfamily